MSLWDEAFGRLGEAVDQGLLEESQIDEAVLRVLKLKFEKVCSSILIWKKTCFPRKKPASRRYLLHWRGSLLCF